MTSRSIGLDIGHTAVRAVALERTPAGWRMAASASVPRCDVAGEPRTLGAVIGELDSLIGLGRTPVTVADSEHAILVRFVATIPMPPDRLAKLLRLELSQHADQGGELAADSFPVPLDGDEVIHACALGQPPQTHAFLGELARAGVVPRRIHVGAAAIFNTTLLAPPVSGDELALLVDIGAETTRVALVGEGRLLAFRQLATGGQAFTEALAQSRGIDLTKAEKLKINWGLGQTVSPAAAAEPIVHQKSFPTTASFIESGPVSEYIETDQASPPEVVISRPAEMKTPAVDSGTPDFPEEAPHSDEDAMVIVEEEEDQKGFDDMLEEGLQEPGAKTVRIGGSMLGAEMTRAAEGLHVQIFNTLTWFRAQLQRDKLPVGRVLVCGGGAALAGLAPYLARRLGIPVELFNPSKGIEGDKPDNIHQFAGAIGLALSDHPSAVRLDLLPESVVKRRMWRERLVWPYVAAAAVIVAAFLVCWTRWQEHEGLRLSLADFQAHQRDREKQEKELAELETNRKAQSADLATIASRIHFNRDLLYVIRVLKEQVPTNQELWITHLETKEPAAKQPTRTALLGHKPQMEETTVERGEIVIEGQVKFDRNKSKDDRRTLFDDYRKAVQSAKAGSTGQPLFDPTKTEVLNFSDVESKTKAIAGAKPKPDSQKPLDGSVFFEFNLVFLPTELNQGTVAIEKPESEAH